MAFNKKFFNNIASSTGFSNLWIYDRSKDFVEPDDAVPGPGGIIPAETQAEILGVDLNYNAYFFNGVEYDLKVDDSIMVVASDITVQYRVDSILTDEASETFEAIGGVPETIAATFNAAGDGQIVVYLNGTLQVLTTDYTISTLIPVTISIDTLAGDEVIIKRSGTVDLTVF